jgi:hypothetical protein
MPRYLIRQKPETHPDRGMIDVAVLEEAEAQPAMHLEPWPVPSMLH